MNSLLILKYSERAYIILGDTKPVKDEIKRIPAKFNSRLTHPLTGSKVAGWIFSAKHIDGVNRWIETRPDIKVVENLKEPDTDGAVDLDFDDRVVDQAYNQMTDYGRFN